MIRAAVVGASGYSGAELVSILASHPDASIASVHGDSTSGQRWEDLYPGKRHLFHGELRPFDPASLAGLDVVFLALPHGASGKAAAALHGKVGCVIDLSGDLRLADGGTYRRWYGAAHPAPELIGKAAYGLPELFACALPGVDLVSCAGCYATAAQLAAAPALSAVWAGSAGVIVTGASGTSGAGRKADVALSHSEVGGNMRAYRVGRHQHSPEIAQGLTRHTGKHVTVTFVPILVPIVRGILSSVVILNERGWTQDDVLQAYRTAYEGKPFVRVVDPRQRMPEVADVVGTNFVDVCPVVDEEAGNIVAVSVIDNLIKGAAGQAVQCMNVVFGLDETLGLLQRAPIKDAARAAQ